RSAPSRKVTVASKVVENDFTLSSANIAALLILFTASTAACRKWWFINSHTARSSSLFQRRTLFLISTPFSVLHWLKRWLPTLSETIRDPSREYLALPAPSATSNTLHPDTSLKLR